MSKALALTMGEPAGIGPEITSSAWRDRRVKDLPPFFVIGDPALYRVPVQEITAPAEAPDIFGQALPVLPLKLKAPAKAGTPDPANASVVLESIRRAAELAISGEAGGIVTNPIHKAVLKEAGFPHPGHTEYLGELCGISRSVMMLAAKDLRVVPLTIHMALKEVPGALTQSLVVETARIVHAALKKDFGISSPRLAVAGLNPHAGEGGAFGREDIEVLQPAIEQLRAEGMNARGPLPADTMFHEDARRSYDVALCAYHDQALIPLKTLDFYGGVNVTLGLPIVRTSPDHGTALDIAGQGKARPDSLFEALKTAQNMASRRG